MGAPVHIAWQVTRECNLSCVHCYADARRGAEARLLSTSEAKKFIAEAAELGVRSIVFTGGEPLMRADTMYLVEFTSDVGLKPIVATNGTLMTEEEIRVLKGARASVAINLPAVEEEVHKRFTGVGSSLRAKLSALERCLRYGLECSIGIAITKLNSEGIDDVLDYAVGKGIRADLLAVVPYGRARAELVLSGLEYRSFLQHVWEKWEAVPMNEPLHEKRVSIYEPIYLALLSEREKEGLRRLCSIGETLHVMEDGSLRACVFIPYTVGNVRKEGIIRAWRKLTEDKFIAKLRDPEKLKGACGSCPSKTICGGCRARAYLIKGDPLASDPVCWLTLSC